MVGNENGLFWDTATMGSQLTPEEIALRNVFVEEYFKDYDAYQACIRVGFLPSFAMDYARKFMGESYVLRKIAELTVKPGSNEDEEAKKDKALIKTVLRQAAQNGPYNSRVAAVSKLASIYGLDRPANTEGEEEERLIEAFRDFAARAPV